MTRIIAAAISTTQTVGSVHQFFVEIREIRVSKRDKLPQLHFCIEKTSSRVARNRKLFGHCPAPDWLRSMSQNVHQLARKSQPFHTWLRDTDFANSQFRSGQSSDKTDTLFGVFIFLPPIFLPVLLTPSFSLPLSVCNPSSAASPPRRSSVKP